MQMLERNVVTGVKQESIRQDRSANGRCFEDEAGRWRVLDEVRSKDVSLPRDQQARDVFETIERALEEAGMNFNHVIRTWFFLDDILSWYGDFNRVRTAFFVQHGVFSRLVPASTAVGTTTSQAAIVAKVVALKPNGEHVRIRSVPSPLQRAPVRYGSAFSRAVEVASPGQRRLYVSGTASIAPDGRTAHPHDVPRQIRHTMAVVGAILDSVQMDWADATRAVAYFARPRGVTVFNELCRQYQLPLAAVTFARGEICRGDLLFELEADFVQRREHSVANRRKDLLCIQS